MKPWPDVPLIAIVGVMLFVYDGATLWVGSFRFCAEELLP